VAAHLRAGTEELPLRYPVTTEIPKHEPAYRDAIRDFYDASAAAIAKHLDAGRTVAVLSEGDPLFYGSYMHLHVRLGPRYPVEIVAGVTEHVGLAGRPPARPIAQGDDVFTVLPATLPQHDLERRLADCRRRRADEARAPPPEGAARARKKRPARLRHLLRSAAPCRAPC